MTGVEYVVFREYYCGFVNLVKRFNMSSNGVLFLSSVKHEGRVADVMLHGALSF